MLKFLIVNFNFYQVIMLIDKIHKLTQKILLSQFKQIQEAYILIKYKLELEFYKINYFYSDSI